MVTEHAALTAQPSAARNGTHARDVTVETVSAR
jgi:hypothetical protein